MPGLFEIKGWYIWVPFLDPDDIKIISLGVIIREISVQYQYTDLLFTVLRYKVKYISSVNI